MNEKIITSINEYFTTDIILEKILIAAAIIGTGLLLFWISGIRLFRIVILNRFDISQKDNLKARKVFTQNT